MTLSKETTKIHNGGAGVATNIKDKSGKTDPEQRNAGNLIPTKKVRKSGWTK